MSSESPSASSQTDPTPPTHLKPHSSRVCADGKSHIGSCVLCQQRKVRCDRLPAGCSNCTKARVDCIYRAHAPPRRRKRKVPEADLLLRLKQYEDLLKSLGVDLDIGSGDGGPLLPLRAAPVEGREVSAMTAELSTVKLRERTAVLTEKGAEGATSGVHPGMEYGKVVGKGTSKRYLSNSLWTSVSEEVHDPNDMLNESSEEEEEEEADTEGASPFGASGIYPDSGDFILRYPRLVVKLEELHPPPVHMFKLWQLFLDGVNPLTKVIHAPTLQQLVLEATGNLQGVSKSTEALLFAIYSSAIATLGNTQCEHLFGHNKKALTKRYQFAAQQALSNAGFMKTYDITVLQAFAIYLLSIFHTHDPRSLWGLTGLSVRIAQRLGLHRDGAALGLSIFEVEMRRRLWWMLVILDSRVAEICGAGIANNFWDCQAPLNVNDSDLTPDMKEQPMEHTGPTEMIFALLRCEVGTWFKQSFPISAFDGSWNKLTTSATPLEKKMKSISELETILEKKFFQYCDPSIPLHFLVATVGKSSICKMRFSALLREYQGQNGRDMSQDHRDELYNLCTKILGYHSLLRNNKAMEKFMWHIANFIQWQPFIFLLYELRSRTSGEDVDKAWQHVEEIYHERSELISQTKRALHIATGNLVVKAWDAYEARQGPRAYRGRAGPPPFIAKLRSQRKMAPATPDMSTLFPGSQWGKTLTFPQQSPMTKPTPLSTYSEPPFGGSDMPNALREGFHSAPFGSSALPPEQSNSLPVDWEQWNNLLKDFDMDQMEGIGDDPLAPYG